MATEVSFMQTLADLFPFKEKTQTLVQPHAKHGEEGMCDIAKQFEGDLTSKEAFEAYKAREVDINTKANFLRTIGGYMNMITTSLGGMAIGLLAMLTPLKALIPGAVTTLEAIGGGASIMSFFVPIAIAAVVFGVATLAVGQYATRMETARNTDNTDFYTRRGSQIGAKLAAPIQAQIQSPILAKAIVEELNNNVARSDGKTWAQAVSENAEHATRAEHGQISVNEQADKQKPTEKTWVDSTRQDSDHSVSEAVRQ
jgi:hypothetical protein